MYSYPCCLLFFVVYLVTQIIYNCVIVLQSEAGIATRTLTPSHKSPVVRGPMAQTADGNLVVQALSFSIKCYSPFWGCDPEGSVKMYFKYFF